MKSRMGWLWFCSSAGAALVICAAGAGCEEFDEERAAGAARQVLSASLSSPEGRIRGMAIESMMQLGSVLPDDALVGLANDPDPRVKMMAVVALGGARNRRHVLIFRERFGDADVNVRLAAAYSLARSGDMSHMMALRDGLMNREATVRRNAAYLLGLLGEPSAAGMLKSGLTDGDALVALRSAEAMHRLGDHSGIPVVRHLTGHPSHQVQYEAVRILGGMGQTVEMTRLRRLANSPHLDVRFAAICGMAKLGDFSRMQILLEVLALDTVNPRTRSRLAKKLGVDVSALERTETDTRAMAALELAETGYTPALPDLARLLGSRQPLVRLAGAVAILKIHSSGEAWRQRARAVEAEKDGSTGSGTVPKPKKAPQTNTPTTAKPAN
ncbi:MAG: HEAT repeat domain-containing protein [Phycisphaerae bacterium]|nr:HEAT repeat domain-containing protein [Phycisphaerae bacterium]